MWCTRLDRERKENSQMKTIAKKAAKALKPRQAMPKAAVEIFNAEPELGSPKGITIKDRTEVVNPTEAKRQEQMKADLTKLKAGDKKRKATVKAAKAPKAAQAKPAKAARVAKEKAPKAAKKAKAAKEPKMAGTSKKDQVLALISGKNGATLDEIITATGWQKHTVRGFIAILGKKGTKIESFKSEAGARTYKAA
jgi:hypothetical protein